MGASFSSCILDLQPIELLLSCWNSNCLYSLRRLTIDRRLCKESVSSLSISSSRLFDYRASFAERCFLVTGNAFTNSWQIFGLELLVGFKEFMGITFLGIARVDYIISNSEFGVKSLNLASIQYPFRNGQADLSL